MEKIDAILEMFDRYGRQSYGEGVTQLEHALQSALIAQQQNANVPLIAAALLHDIGHFLADPNAAATQFGSDPRHEDVAAAWLSDSFGPEVTEPIRMHVAAKRYLCAVDSDYLSDLSFASKMSLAAQGGPFSSGAADEFMKQPFAADALRLRRWDDAAKIPGLPTPTLRDFLPTLHVAMKVS